MSQPGPNGDHVQRGDIWFVDLPDGDRPVVVLTRDPVAGRIGSVVVASLTRTVRGLVSEVGLAPKVDGVPTECVINLDNVHTIERRGLRRHVTTLGPARMAAVCRALADAVAC